jgi:hypothetical protein
MLCEAGQEVTRIHDLSILLAALARLDGSLSVLDPAARALTDFAVRYRYPGAIANRTHARAALGHATLIREAIRHRLGQATVRRPSSRGSKSRRRR